MPETGESYFAQQVSRHLVEGVTGIPHKNVQGFVSRYLVLHADHGGGNASAHTSRLVSSTLADPFVSLAAALCGLSRPFTRRSQRRGITVDAEAVQLCE